MFSTYTSFKVNVLKKKHSSSTWGHDFKSSDPKIVGQEGKPLRIRQWSHESCQFSYKYLQLQWQHCMSFLNRSDRLLSPIIPSIFMHSTIPFIPTGQGMRCRSKHNHMRGDLQWSHVGKYAHDNISPTHSFCYPSYMPFLFWLPSVLLVGFIYDMIKKKRKKKHNKYTEQ